MLQDATLVAFIATTQPERAKAFYAGKLGLQLVEESPYALVFRAGETMLRVQLVQALEAQPFTALGWAVDDIVTTAAAIKAAGIEMVDASAFVTQDEAGIWWTPNGDGVAWFKDPDGNTLSLTQFAP